MSKCNKVKTPCKICLRHVSTKNGVHCQGNCGSWVHFACLNYTPGKIKDIKAGIIKVTCPCPDCKTFLPKEYRTDEPFSCNNTSCPANMPPKCDNKKCPVNKKQPPCPPPAPPCPLQKCGTSCKEFRSSSPKPPCEPPSPCGSPGSSPMSCSAPNVMEQMCNTVGQLTCQINDLMEKMKHAVNTQGGGGKTCSKPCYCSSKR